jgi:RNA polymerase sigma factor (TIGR02999 family)
VSDSCTGPSSLEVTELLKAWGQGDKDALNRLIPLVYEELRTRAHRYMRQETPGHTLQTTALVNEVYLRLIDVSQVDWQDRAHFFAVTARMMRRILTDFARSRGSLKRGGEAVQVSFDEALALSPQMDIDLVALDEALTDLAALDERKSQVIELRFFGGRSLEETAEALEVSPKTVTRDFNFAKAWLHRRLSAVKGDDAQEPAES